MFISPSRSELKAIADPSGAHAPRLSTRVPAATDSGSPVAAPVSVDTGSRQRSELIPRTANATWPPGPIADWMSSPAPVVICSGMPAGTPDASSGIRQRLSPPPLADV
jgi:hypothetical protein